MQILEKLFTSVALIGSYTMRLFTLFDGFTILLLGFGYIASLSLYFSTGFWHSSGCCLTYPCQNLFASICVLISNQFWSWRPAPRDPRSNGLYTSMISSTSLNLQQTTSICIRIAQFETSMSMSSWWMSIHTRRQLMMGTLCATQLQLWA